MIRNLSIFAICLAGFALLSAPAANAQQQLSDLFPGQGGFGADLGGGLGAEPVSIEAELIPVDALTVDVKVTLNVATGFYTYSSTTPFGKKTKIQLDAKKTDFRFDGSATADHPPKIVEEYGSTMEKYYGSVSWTQRLVSKTGPISNDLKIGGQVTGQYCSNETCQDIDPPLTFVAKLPADFDASNLAAPELATPATKRSTANVSSATQSIVPDMSLPRGASTAPVKFEVSVSPSNPQAGEHVVLSIKADIQQPWHIYSTTVEEGIGAVPTVIELTSIREAEASELTFRPDRKPEESEGAFPGSTLESFHDEVTWQREFVVTDSAAVFAGKVDFQICNGSSCLSPASIQFQVSTDAAGNVALVADSTDAAENGGEQKEDLAAWIPFILAAITAGFVALLTPCVFPMIPVTVSYFLKQGEANPGSSIRLAVIYCIGIIGAFTILGLAVSVVLGPTALNALANNRWLNLFFAFVFTVFGLMLLGMFEFQIPSWVLTWSSKKQESGGVIGVLFMALTFTLVSFTCTFAFVGNILVLAASGQSYLRPIVGMAAFSAAFASPFFLLALFPSFLKKLPKSGGWMNRVKVTLGLLELAVVVKFLSVADIGFSPEGLPRYLDYHMAMGIWIAIGIVIALYLLHIFRTSHDTPSESVPAFQCLIAIGFLCTSAYITVGLFSANPPRGALWQQIVAFAPPQLEIDGLFIDHDGLKYSLDFDAAVASAENSQQPMFLDFTGVNCINCRKMENTVLKADDVHEMLADLVKVQLYTDIVPGVKEGSEAYDRLLARNKTLQKDWLKDTTLPAYVIATPDGKEILAVHKGYEEGGQQFRKFLKSGLNKWRQLQEDELDQQALNTKLTVKN